MSVKACRADARAPASRPACGSSSIGRGLADHDFLAVLFPDRLVHRQHPHVSQNCFGDEFFDAGLFRRFVAARQQHVDVIVRAG